MTYRFLPDVAIADIAFEAKGTTLPKLFREAARALMAVQIENMEKVRPRQKILLELEEKDIETLLHRFLQELVYWKDAQQLLLLPKTLEIKAKTGAIQLRTMLAGEPLDPSRHEQRADIKAVTWHLFRVARPPSGRRASRQPLWCATVVLDV